MGTLLGGEVLRIALLALIVCGSASFAACASAPGRLEANRFQHERYPYALFYVPGGTAEYPLGPHYTVENFHSPDGRHRYARLSPELTVDRTYRDETPAVVGREPFYDLLLTRDASPTQAKLWIRSVPLAKAEQDTPVAALAQRYVDAVRASGRVAAPFGIEEVPAGSPAELRDVRTRSCELSKREAVRIDFALQNPAAGRKLSEPEWWYASVVLIRSGYFARVHYPVILLAARVNGAADDAALERDFERMLELLVLGDKGRGLSMKGGHTCGASESGGEQHEAPAPGEGTSGDLRAPTLEVPVVIEDPEMPEPPSAP